MSSRNIVILMLSILLIGLLVFLFGEKNDKNSEKNTVVAPASVPLSSKAEDATAATNNNAVPIGYVSRGLTEEDIIAMIKKYIDENPEVIMKSIENYYAAKADESKAIQKNMVIQLKDQIYNNLNDPRLGNPKGSIKIVEFFDYACSFCRKMLPIHQKILADYPEVQIILKELPIMGDWSLIASKAALAVSVIDNNKYSSFHSRLLSIDDKTEDSIMQAAVAEGIDVSKMKETMQKVEIEDIIQANLKLSADLKIRGTPAYIINNDVLPGALSYTEMKSTLEAAGAKKVPSVDAMVNAKTAPVPLNTSTSDTAKAAEPVVPANGSVKKDDLSDQKKAMAAAH